MPKSTTHQGTFRRRLRKAEKHLMESCPQMRSWIEAAGNCKLQPEWDRAPMESLIRAVAHQQLHAKAAEAILGRLLSHFEQEDFPTSQQLTRLRIAQYRKFGFSETKANAIRGIAKATSDGKVPTRSEADQMSDDDLIRSLTELRGIGKWTVEMMLIFTLGRIDIMPVDDYGVKAGLMHLYKLEEMPKKKDFPSHTDAWAPYRTVGAWYLWRLADARKVSQSV